MKRKGQARTIRGTGAHAVFVAVSGSLAAVTAHDNAQFTTAWLSIAGARRLHAALGEMLRGRK